MSLKRAGSGEGTKGMQCRNHPYRNAEHICTSCKTPLCNECAEEVSPGVYSCFQCAMLQSVSKGGTTLADKKSAAERVKREKRKWGPFHFFVTVSSVLILIMWGVILFGGKTPPTETVEFSKEGRVLLFMVDGALKRYAQYKNDTYPERLSDLVPNYLPFKESDLYHLARLSYRRDPKTGYQLSLTHTRKGEMKVVLSPQGIRYLPSAGGV